MGCQSKTATSGADQSKITALKDSRQKGIITQREYKQKMEAFMGASASPGGPSGVWSGTHKQDVIDPHYQMTAYTLDVPDGWKFAGTIARDPGCHSAGAGLKYTMQSPDGLTGLVVMPGATWSWSDSPRMQAIMANSQCPAVDLDTAAAFQRAQAENNRQFQTFMQNNQAQFEQRVQQNRAFQQQLQHSTDQAMAADRTRQAAIDASAHQQVLQSLNQQEFRNPATGEVLRASNQYNHQWMSSDGSTLIQTNDPTYDPNGQVYPVSQSWTELVPK